MDRCLLLFLVHVLVLSFAAVSSYASLPAQIYWQTKLPNTPMPTAIRDLLLPEGSTSVDVGKGGVHVDAGSGKPGGTTVGVGKGGVQVDAGKGKPSGTTVGVGKGGVQVDAGKGKTGGTTVGVGGGGVNVNAGQGNTRVGVGKGGVGVVTGHQGHPVVVRVTPGKSPFDYRYAAAADQLDADPSAAFFFLEKDLKGGAKRELRFPSSPTGAAFLSRSAAEAMPFSSSKLPELLGRFSIDPKSEDAEAMKDTLESCEAPAAEGESKYCATSLESMVDFATSRLGKNPKPLTTSAKGDQVYSISAGVKQSAAGSKSVSCHSQAYLYAVYLCHETQATDAYKVAMVGEDGKKVEAVAVCHKDTSKWNPKHLAFQVLKVKPGSVPICHFLPQDHIVWVQ